MGLMPSPKEARPVKISTVVILQFNDDLTEFEKIVDVSHEYSGPVALCKKGREAQQQLTQFDINNAKNLAGQGNQQYNVLNNLENEEIASTAPGSLSPAAAAMYSSDLQNISDVYNGLRRNAFTTNAARGFGSAPSGFQNTTLNSIQRGQDTASTNAFRQAQINTENQRQNVLNTASGARNASIAGATSSANAGGQSALDQSRQGSTLGDILGGASSILGGLSGFTNFFKQLRGGNNGNYGGKPFNDSGSGPAA